MKIIIKLIISCPEAVSFSELIQDIERNLWLCYNNIITPCACARGKAIGSVIITLCACARGKVISLVVVVVVVVVDTKIAKSERVVSTTNMSNLAKNWLQFAQNRVAWPTSVTNSVL